MFYIRPEIAVSFFVGAAMVLLTRMTAQRRMQRTGVATSPNYAKAFLIAAGSTYLVMYFALRNSAAPGKVGGGGEVEMDDLLSMIDMSGPNF